MACGSGPAGQARGPPRPVAGCGHPTAQRVHDASPEVPSAAGPSPLAPRPQRGRHAHARGGTRGAAHPTSSAMLTGRHGPPTPSLPRGAPARRCPGRPGRPAQPCLWYQPRRPTRRPGHRPIKCQGHPRGQATRPCTTCRASRAARRRLRAASYASPDAPGGCASDAQGVWLTDVQDVSPTMLRVARATSGTSCHRPRGITGTSGTTGPKSQSARGPAPVRKPRELAPHSPVGRLHLERSPALLTVPVLDHGAKAGRGLVYELHIFAAALRARNEAARLTCQLPGTTLSACTGTGRVLGKHPSWFGPSFRLRLPRPDLTPGPGIPLLHSQSPPPGPGRGP